MNYVKRLVGLPGEEVFIKDGSALDQRPAVGTAGIAAGIEVCHRVPEWPRWARKSGARPDRPAKLGAGEYFVLGDFSQQSGRLSTLGNRRPRPSQLRRAGILSHRRGHAHLLAAQPLADSALGGCLKSFTPVGRIAFAVGETDLPAIAEPTVSPDNQGAECVQCLAMVRKDDTELS